MVWNAVGCWLLPRSKIRHFINEMSSSVDDAATLDFSKQIKLSVTGGTEEQLHVITFRDNYVKL